MVSKPILSSVINFIASKMSLPEYTLTSNKMDAHFYLNVFLTITSSKLCVSHAFLNVAS